MGRLATTVAGLGTPRFDGESGVIQTPSGRTEALFWDAADELWRGNRYLSMRMLDNLGMRASGSAALWKYPSQGENPLPPLQSPAPTAYGFQIHTVIRPGELWDAGLRLQEHISCEMGQVNGTDLPQPALNWYELGQADPFLSPVPDNQGVRVVGEIRDDGSQVNWGGWYSSGWQNSPVVAPAAGVNWYPELYVLGEGANMRNLVAWHRWAGPESAVGSLGSQERASQYPPLDTVISWHQARTMPLADGAAVAEWPDQSGRHRHLKQATVGKRPVVRRDAVGALRHVRMDGVDDVMEFVTGASFGQPGCIFVTMRQNAGGPAQQVWFGPTSGAPIIYRSDTDQVNVWAGGDDVPYTRASPWPSPWMVMSVVLADGFANVWENLTEVANVAGGGGLGSFAVSRDSTPSKIDVAEVVVAASEPTSGERTTMVQQMAARAGITLP